jgi:hypothetical protein
MHECCPLLVPYHPKNLVESYNDQHGMVVLTRAYALIVTDSNCFVVLAVIRLYAAMALSNTVFV